MTRAAALLIVLALTGGPVASAACIVWCESWSITGDCGNGGAGPMSTTISGGGSTCAALLADRPFLREEVRVTLHTPVLLDVSSTLDALPEGDARLASIGDGGRAIDHRPGPTLVLRL